MAALVRIANTHKLKRRLREAMDREGLGPSKWRKRDCVTLVRAVIRELSGSEPVFDLPAWADGMSEQEAIRRAPREHGTLRKGWLAALAAEPSLKRLPKRTTPAPGMIALTPARGFELDCALAPPRGPLLGVIGPDCALWVRAHDGLRRAHPVSEMWGVI